jgi:hypothetical protein
MRSRQILFVFLFALSIVAANAQTERRSVVLPQSESKPLLGEKRFADQAAASGTWAPSQSDVDGLEINLSQIEELSRKYSPYRRVEHPENYFRQYMGLLVGGRRMIYVNAFCGMINNGQPPKGWGEHLEEIMDGGNCVWQSLYDISTKKFIALSVNGRA